MSYSFKVSAADVPTMTRRLCAELDRVIASQPIHAADRDAAINAVQGLAAVIAVPKGKMMSISVSGSVAHNGKKESPIVGASIHVQVDLVDMPEASVRPGEAKAEG